MNRSAMRENAFKLVYSLEIQQEENLEEQIDLFFESNSITDEETKKYIKDVILGIKKEEDTFIVNYKTGEVINETKKTTKSGKALYIYAKNE